MDSEHIAVATSDGVSVADHLARSTSFRIVEVNNGQVSSSTVRPRATGACGQHATFVDLLSGCKAVVCGGIGQGAADSLAANGIQPLVVAGGLSIDEAITRYLTRTLVTTDERVCLCH